MKPKEALRSEQAPAGASHTSRREAEKSSTLSVTTQEWLARISEQTRASHYGNSSARPGSIMY